MQEGSTAVESPRWPTKEGSDVHGTPLEMPGASLARLLGDVAVPVVSGSVAGVVGHEVEVRGLRMRVGEAIAIDTAAGRRLGQVVSVRQGSVRALVMGDATGLGAGDRV